MSIDRGDTHQVVIRHRSQTLNRFKQQIREAAAFLVSKLERPPHIGVVTGTGLGDAVGPLEERLVLDYADIPHFPVSTVTGHSGRLLVGLRDGHPLIVMQGRFHLYEGYTPCEVTFPMR
ncbi:MAG: hypothetical protein WBY88_07115, partial [Desulfosarcina sp.]